MQGKNALRKKHFPFILILTYLKKLYIISNFLNSKLNSIINYSS
jgi:hypothetical protein